MIAAVRSLAGLAALSAVGTVGFVPAFAQPVTTRSEAAASGKVIRLVVSPNLKKDCSPGLMPEIKVVAAPKNGQLQTKTGKLKTPASYRCPNKEAQVAGLFYRSKAGFAGTDQVLLEIKTAEGTVEKQDIRINVEAAKAGDTKLDAKKPDDKKDDKDLSDL